MTDDALLFAAALANPAEDTPRLVLADWFDEHDEPELAAALRAHREVVAYLGELTRWDVSPALPSQRYDERNEMMRDLFPLRPTAQLLTRYISLFPRPPHLEYPPHTDTLPTPTELLNAWQRGRARQVALVREMAARASDREDIEPDTFAPTDDPRTFESQCCLLQELVLRGRNVFRVPGADAHAERMRERGHPLAWLSRRLLTPDAELSFHVPRFTPGGGAMFGAPVVGEPLPVRTVGAGAPAVVGAEPFAPESPLFDAVRGWGEVSNGSAEGYAFRLDKALIPDRVGRLWFSRLPAGALNAALVTPHWAVERVQVSGALAVLFGAAHNGGAYGRRQWGAYGRLFAWRSLAALAGCPPHLEPEDVARVADGCEWFTFSGTQWFAQVAWDLGLICLRPDRSSIALLAATDTD